MTKARSILKRHGQGVANLSILDPKCYPAVLVAAREALALDLAAFAPIFPLKPDGKKPCSGSNGHHEATKDTKRILTWVRERPNCNWGFRGGEPAHLQIPLVVPPARTSNTPEGLA